MHMVNAMKLVHCRKNGTNVYGWRNADNISGYSPLFYENNQFHYLTSPKVGELALHNVGGNIGFRKFTEPRKYLGEFDWHINPYQSLTNNKIDPTNPKKIYAGYRTYTAYRFKKIDDKYREGYKHWVHSGLVGGPKAKTLWKSAGMFMYSSNLSYPLTYEKLQKFPSQIYQNSFQGITLMNNGTYAGFPTYNYKYTVSNVGNFMCNGYRINMFDNFYIDDQYSKGIPDFERNAAFQDDRDSYGYYINASAGNIVGENVLQTMIYTSTEDVGIPDIGIFGWFGQIPILSTINETDTRIGNHHYLPTIPYGTKLKIQYKMIKEWAGVDSNGKCNKGLIGIWQAPEGKTTKNPDEYFNYPPYKKFDKSNILHFDVITEEMKSFEFVVTGDTRFYFTNPQHSQRDGTKLADDYFPSNWRDLVK